MSDWLTTKEALEITKKYKRAPKSKSAIIWAGIQGGFMRKMGHHCEFSKYGLIAYCEISNKPTLQDIADELNTSVGSVKYIAMKNNIKFRYKMGRKFLEKEDAKRIIELYERSHYGRD